MAMRLTTAVRWKQPDAVLYCILNAILVPAGLLSLGSPQTKT